MNFLDELSDSGTIAEMLHNQLVTSVSRNSSLLDALLVIIGKMGYGMESLAGKSLNNLLFRSDTDIALLKAVKTYSKKLSTTVDAGAEHVVGVTLYYAAIASAIVNHSRKISSSSYKTLERSFIDLVDEDWLTTELKELFSKARDICRQKREKDDE